MPLLKLEFRPGVFRDGTRYSAEGTWYDCDKVRFRKGLPEKIGGWEKFVSASFLGSCRKIHDWGTIDGARYVGTGTNLKLYAQEGSSYNDITPIRSTVTLGTDPFDATNGTGVVTVNHTAHGAVAGDYVTFSGATTFAGIPVGDLNQEHRVDSTPDADTYTIVVDTAATSTASGGGSAIEAAYQINTGLDTFVGASGWGAGSWGSGSWGGSTTLSDSNQLRLWTMDNFGDDLVTCVRQGGVFYWDESNGTGTRAVNLHELTRRTVTLTNNPIATENTSATITITDIGGHGAGAGDTVTISGAAATNGIPAGEINAEHVIVSTPTDTTFTVTVTTAATSTGSGGGSAVQASYQAGQYYTPTSGLQVMVSPVARHIIVFGTNDIGGTELDPLLVRWCASENAAEWEPREENSAGGQRLSFGSSFVGAIRTRQEIVIWTDVGMTSMRYTGSPFIFSFVQVATNVSLIAPNAAVNANGVIFFMDRGGFYTYSGAVRRLVCPVRDYVFSNIDFNQANKIFAGTNVDLSEVMWFYPSSSGDGEIDSYVMYNYDENVWTFGTLERGHWAEAPTKTYPLASSLNKETLGTDPIATTNTSQTITITHTSHGMSAGDTVIISGASAVGGLSSGVLNTEYTIASVVDADNYTITVPDTATSTATGGGGAVQVRKPNYLFSHEVGHDADGAAMTAYIESADMDLEDGEHYWFVRRLIPDVQFRDSADSEDAILLDVYAHNYPGGTRTQRSTSTVKPATEQNWVRLRARQVSLRAESTGSGYGWRLGNVRFDARQDGRR